MEQIIGDASREIKTKTQAQIECSNQAFLSHVESKNINDALDDEF